MGFKHKKLKQWVEAGLIAPAQADDIQAFEDSRKRGTYGRGMVGLAIFAIGFGVLSIIAANWILIPATVKIGLHIIINVIVGMVAVMAYRRVKPLVQEGASLLFFALSLTLILLVGQVYQLDGDAADVFLLWIVMTFPFFWMMGKGYMTAAPWMVGFLAMLFLVLVKYVPLLSDEDHIVIALSYLPVLLPLGFVGLGVWQKFIRVKPALASLFLQTGFWTLIFLASSGLIMWPFTKEIYENGLYLPLAQVAALVSGLLLITLHAMRHQFYKSDAALKYGAIFCGGTLVAMYLPVLLPFLDSTVLAAVSFIAYWVFFGWYAQMTGRLRLVSLAIFIIAIRIYVMYLELFGSLMMTGLGLIVGGVVMLALMYAAKKINTRMMTRLAPKG
jgi:uncharacterized membrane protein